MWSQEAADAGKQEGEADRRPRRHRSNACDHEDARAHAGADADEREVQGTQAPLEALGRIALH